MRRFHLQGLSLRTARLMTLAAVLASIVVSAQVPDRSRPPQPSPPAALKLPAIQKRQLSNGLPVWMVELHEVPVAQVNLVVFNGAAYVSAGKLRVTHMMATFSAPISAPAAGSMPRLFAYMSPSRDSPTHFPSWPMSSCDRHSRRM